MELFLISWNVTTLVCLPDESLEFVWALSVLFLIGWHKHEFFIIDLVLLREVRIEKMIEHLQKIDFAWKPSKWKHHLPKQFQTTRFLD